MASDRIPRAQARPSDAPNTLDSAKRRPMRRIRGNPSTNARPDFFGAICGIEVSE
jgi:hypothetical protein